MARPREFDPQAALQTAIDVFWEKGYFDGSVDEIVRRSGVAKYGIYGTFGSKRELFIQALHQYGKDRRNDMQQTILASDASLPEIIEYFNEMSKRVMHPTTERRGCLLCNAGVELATQDPEIGALVNAYFDDLTDVLQGCLRRAIVNEEIAEDADVERLGRFLATEFRVLLMLAASGKSQPEIWDHMETALLVLR